ncbi:ATP-binding protein [Streptomyces griseoviridis]
MEASSASVDVTFRLPRSRRSVPRARAALLAVLGGWEVDQEVGESAELVLSELLTNALKVPVPRGHQVGVRIARAPAEGLLRLEVSDTGGGRPEARTPDTDETGGRGLLLVEALADRWGYEEHGAGIGKTVWAELKSPTLLTEPGTREIAAALVRPGQWVRMWGEWRSVQSTQSEPDPSTGVMILLTLDEGPPLRIRATEPLRVRGGRGEDG